MHEAKPVKRTPFIAKIGAIVIIALLVRQTFGGMLRLYLQEFNLNFLWFIPDALIAVAIALSFLAAFKSKELVRRVVLGISIAFLALPALSGYLNGNSLLSIVSGYKIIAPLVLCINTPFLLREMTRRYFAVWCVLLAITLLFLIGNQFIDYAWVGGKFSQFGVEKDVSREWYAGYFKEGPNRITVTRHAGASVASVSAAALIVLFYALIRTRLQRWWIEALVLLLCTYGIFLTDSKTSYFCLLLIFICGNVGRLQNVMKGLMNFDLKTGVQQGLSWLLLAVGFIPMVIGFSREPVPYFAYDSFMDRVNFTWPSSVGHMAEIGGAGSYLWGTGYGSFGSSAIYNALYIQRTSDVDNFLLYQYAVVGVLALGLYYLLARVATKAEGTAMALFAALIPYSFATNNESPEYLLLAGLAVSNILYSSRIQWLPFKTGIKIRY